MKITERTEQIERIQFTKQREKKREKRKEILASKTNNKELKL